MTHKLNTDKTVAVAEGYYWMPMDENTPRHVKIQMLSMYGVAMYGTWDGRNTFWTHWAPLPRRRTEEETK